MMNELAVIPVQDLQQRRCSSCTDYECGICNNKNKMVSGRKFKPGNTCIHHSSGSDHLTESRGCVTKFGQFTQEDVAEIRQMYIDGYGVGRIRKDFRSASYSRIYYHIKDLINERKLLEKKEAANG